MTAEKADGHGKKANQPRGAGRADRGELRRWVRPTLTVIEIRDTEVGTNSNDDGGGFS